MDWQLSDGWIYHKGGKKEKEKKTKKNHTKYATKEEEKMKNKGETHRRNGSGDNEYLKN